jgi:tRNA nucleotidyltransferase (CCA-adding enzyme)
MLMNLEEKILRSVHPTDELALTVSSVSNELLSLVRKISAHYNSIEDVRLVGSVAKDTYVAKPDIDIFILFNESLKRDELARSGLEIGRSVLSNWEERYAEHPYIHGSFKGFQVDIVPCYHIKDTSKLMSAVDRTPFHTDYVLGKIGPSEKGQIRLLKQFLKGISAYGAEAKVQGFSGYLVELLIIRYGNFDTMIKEAASWKYGVKLDIEGRGEARFKHPLVFYDPVDPKRNVASALSVEKFNLFIQAAKDYLEGSSERFFYPAHRVPMSHEEIVRKLSDTGFSLIAVKFEKPDLIDDNLYPQAERGLNGLAVQLEHEGFVVLDRSFSMTEEEVVFVYLLESDSLSICKKHYGPPVWMANAQVFLKRWSKEAVIEPFIEGERWVVFIRRGAVTAKDAVEQNMKNAAVGNSFKGAHFTVFDNEESLSSNLNVELSHLLDKRMSWRF